MIQLLDIIIPSPRLAGQKWWENVEEESFFEPPFWNPIHFVAHLLRLHCGVQIHTVQRRHITGYIMRENLSLPTIYPKPRYWCAWVPLSYSESSQLGASIFRMGQVVNHCQIYFPYHACLLFLVDDLPQLVLVAEWKQGQSTKSCLRRGVWLVIPSA